MTSTSDQTLLQIEGLQRQLYELRRAIAGEFILESLPEGKSLLLVCRVNAEPMAIPLTNVDEVVPIAKLSTLPEAPPWIPGLLNLRGTTIPVIDVSARISRARRAPVASDLIVICRVDDRDIGFVVQAVDDIAECDSADVAPAGESIPHAPYLIGVWQSVQGQILLLSVAAISQLSDVPQELA